MVTEEESGDDEEQFLLYEEASEDVEEAHLMEEPEGGVELSMNTMTGDFRQGTIKNLGTLNRRISVLIDTAVAAVSLIAG